MTSSLLLTLGLLATPADDLAAPPVFDAGWYRARHPELADDEAARRHWLTVGLPAGEAGSAQFDPRYYLARYEDLQRAFGADNYLAATRHFLTHGRRERREAVPYEGRLSWLDNGVIRLGCDLQIGGAITWLSRSGDHPNLINSHDWGRQIQMSFYSGPVPFEPGGRKPVEQWAKLGWNPIQSGDVGGYPSRVIEHHNDGRQIYVKCIPMQWPHHNVPGDCTFEAWFELEGPTVKARCRLNNAREDHTQYPGRHQELPAIYTNGPWHKLYTYTGDAPFTGGELTRIDQAPEPTFPWRGWRATETWAALVDDRDDGLGVYTPGVYQYLGGFAGRPGQGGPRDAPTGYIAPLHSEILDHNIVYDYAYTLIVGDLASIRRYVYERAERPGRPNFVFATDRQHWLHRGGVDTGWPLRGEWVVTRQGDQLQLLSPAGFWPTELTRSLVVEAAVTGQATAGRLYFALADGQFKPEQSVAFPVVPDGQFRTWRIDLTTCPTYAGAVRAWRLDPLLAGQPGDTIRLRSIRGEGR